VLKYDDFDLQIAPAGENYRVHLLNAPTGQATTEFALPFTDIEVANFLSRIGQVRRTMRRVDAPGLQAAKEFGGKLFNAIFSGEMIAQLRGSMEEVSKKEHGLRIRLRLTDVPGLADLPWEFLYDAHRNHFLTTSVETPVVRFLDLPERTTPLRVVLPLRVLVMIASPRNLSRLDAEGEWDRLQESLADLLDSGQIVLERLPAATLDALRLRARRAPFHVFHFIGHGGFDDVAQDGVLQFEDESGMSYPVRSELLGMQLHDHRSLRLAVLNACEGARSSRQDPFSGVAQSLLQQRVPAVVAMQFEISDAAAKVFAKEFYSAIAEGSPVDAAVCQARRALFREEFGQEWATPVLYMRSDEGQLFELQDVPPDEDLKRRQAEEAERQAAAKVEAIRQAAEKAEAERAEMAEKESQESKEAGRQRLAGQKAEAKAQAEGKSSEETAAQQQEETDRPVTQQAEDTRLQHEKAAEGATHEKAVARRRIMIMDWIPDWIPERIRDWVKDEYRRPSWRGWLILVAIPAIAMVIWFVHHQPTPDPQAHYRMGELLLSQKNFDGAITHYREAIRINPDYAAAHAGLGSALRETGDLENAIAEFRKVIRLNPQDSKAYNDVGLSLSKKGDLAGAIDEYREAIGLNPQEAETHYNLANALHSQGDHAAAVAEYRETLRLKPDFGVSHPFLEALPAENKDAPSIHQGGDVQAAKLIKPAVQPTYPPIAAQSGVSGTVRLHAIIAKNGTIRKLAVVSGPPLLLQSATDAVKQWRYRPTLLNGQPVEVDTTIDVKYKLKPPPPTPAPTPTPAAQAQCTFGKVAVSAQGNRLIGTVPYNYQGKDPLDSLALRGVPLTKDKGQISGLTYGQSTLKTASGTASFSIEGRPTLDHQEQESSYLIVAIVLKQTGVTVCGELVQYQRKW
jgi:TonB family protein